MTSPTRPHTEPGCVFIRPFDQYPGVINGGNAGLFGLCHDIRTGIASHARTAPGTHPTIPAPGMGKAPRARARVPLPPPHFPPTENTLRQHNVVKRHV